MAAVVLAFLLLAESAEDLYRRGLILLRSNDAAGAIVALESAADLAPSDPLILMAVADARLRLGKTEEALAAEAKAARLAGSDPIVRKARAMFHARFARALNETQKALPHLKEAATLEPGREQYRIEYIQALLDRKAEREAEAECKAALQTIPRSAEIHRLLGIALYAQGRNGEALDEFLQAIDLDPENEIYYSSIEMLLPEADARMPSIVQRLNRFARSHPASPLAAYLQGMIQPERAVELMRHAIELDPSFWPAYFELQKLLPSAKERIPLLKKVVELNPDYAPAYYALGFAYASVGEREAARQAREKHHELTKTQ